MFTINNLLAKCTIIFICCTFVCSCKCGNDNNHVTNGVTGTKDESGYRDAVQNGRFDKAYDILAKYRNEYLSYQSTWDEHYNDLTAERKKAQQKYFAAFDYIYKNEVINILARMEGQDAIDKIVFLLEEIPVDGQKYPQGKCDYDVTTLAESDDGYPLDAYVVWSQHYNTLCSGILTLAINRKNKNLAQQILMQFVDNVEIYRYPNKVDGVSLYSNEGYIKYNKEDYNAACNKYKDAINLGLFD